jgi:arginine/lysine/histidine transporter system substrate-binding protein
MLDESLMDEQNYIIAKKGNTDVIDKMNTCIKKFLASDDYVKLCKKYGLSPLETK